MALERISTLLAPFGLTGEAEKRPRRATGTPRARRSDIRRRHASNCPEVLWRSDRVGAGCACGKRQRQPLPLAYRQARRLWHHRHPKAWMMRELLRQLLRLPPIAGFSIEQFAGEVLMSKRSVQRLLRKLESRHCIKRRHAGRNHPLILEINHIALPAFARRLHVEGESSVGEAVLEVEATPAGEAVLEVESGARPEGEGDMKGEQMVNSIEKKGDNSLEPWIRKSASSATGEANKERNQQDQDPDQEQEQEKKGDKEHRGPPPLRAPSRKDVIDYYQRARRGQNARKRRRGLLGSIRNAAWQRGCKMPASLMFTRLAGNRIAAIGKTTLAEYTLCDVFYRLMMDKNSLPESPGEARQWIGQATEWSTHHREERNWKKYGRPEPPATPTRPAAPATQKPEQIPLPLKRPQPAPWRRPDAPSTAGEVLEAPKSAELEKTRHTDAAGRVFGADPVPQYPPDERVLPTPPMVSNDGTLARPRLMLVKMQPAETKAAADAPVSAARAHELFASLLKGIRKA